MPIRIRIRIGEFPIFGAFPDIPRETRGRPRTALPVPEPPKFPQPPPRGPGGPPTPRPTTVPFPGGVAANDPIFSIARKIIRRGLGALSAIPVIGDLALLFQEHILEQLLAQELAELALAKAKRAAAADPREVTVRESPLPQEPEPLPEAPPRPDIQPFPENLPLPAPVPPPVRVPLPTPLPPQIPVPSPAPPLPLPSPIPAGLPSIQPRFVPLVFPAASPSPVPGPLPSNVPLADPVPLTPVNPAIVQSPFGFVSTVPFPGSQPSPQTNPQRRCQEVKRRRRRKGKCREGFFEELPNKTRYTTWREVDCVTRKKKRKLSIVKRTI